jgi:hypothetical protein
MVTYVRHEVSDRRSMELWCRRCRQEKLRQRSDHSFVLHSGQGLDDAPSVTPSSPETMAAVVREEPQCSNLPRTTTAVDALAPPLGAELPNAILADLKVVVPPGRRLGGPSNARRSPADHFWAPSNSPGVRVLAKGSSPADDFWAAAGDEQAEPTLGVWRRLSEDPVSARRGSSQVGEPPAARRVRGGAAASEPSVLRQFRANEFWAPEETVAPVGAFGGEGPGGVAPRPLEPLGHDVLMRAFDCGRHAIGSLSVGRLYVPVIARSALRALEHVRLGTQLETAMGELRSIIDDSFEAGTLAPKTPPGSVRSSVKNRAPRRRPSWAVRGGWLLAWGVWILWGVGLVVFAVAQVL